MNEKEAAAVEKAKNFLTQEDTATLQPAEEIKKADAVPADKA